ncbi:MAG: bifunctional folylpolyglutamate synthase/dihydrofolate synthase, partial [Bacteroidales bacterium]|nr:bifunctional folylpolyglutamate synthase/dihydrofolate synthase [Bacteroidales bacterium]
MEYNEQIKRLYNRFPSYQVVGNRAYKPGIETIKALDEALGRPHERYRKIHVAGTNGKGSVCHLLAAALACSGLKVGLYSSPHLVDFRERMKVVTADGFRMISKEDVS